MACIINPNHFSCLREAKDIERKRDIFKYVFLMDSLIYFYQIETVYIFRTTKTNAIRDKINY